ncbi:hypothetical protein R1sor_010197 [Riccia sorocarpa]|uniref:F-box domain-containing protein n=1 Tax=Riccia sorocarpa TaxID=122646 RepID=A0ABD3HYR8_9MARC
MQPEAGTDITSRPAGRKLVLLLLWWLALFAQFVLAQVIDYLEECLSDFFDTWYDDIAESYVGASSVEGLVPEVETAPGILLPMLSDQLVEDELVTRLLIDEDPSVMLRLRAINRSWRGCIEHTSEWAAWRTP